MGKGGLNRSRCGFRAETNRARPFLRSVTLRPLTAVKNRTLILSLATVLVLFLTTGTRFRHGLSFPSGYFSSPHSVGEISGGDPGEGEEGRGGLFGRTRKGLAGLEQKRPVGPLEVDVFRDWMGRYRRADAGGREALLGEGMELGRQRRREMAELIVGDPERALELGLGFAEWDALPEAVRVLVERPFSERVDYFVYPVCAKVPGEGMRSRPEGTIRWQSGGGVRAFATGSRAHITSKVGMPAQGITIGSVAAVRAGVFEELPPAERSRALLRFKVSASGPTRSLATGAPIAGEGLFAVSGGSLYAFANREELRGVERTLAALDRMPAPKAGSSLLSGYAGALGEAGEFRAPVVQAAAAAISREWTTGHKRIFIIRVRFPDSDEGPPSQEEVEQMLNWNVASDIRDFSSGKATLEASASSEVYVLPQSAQYYANLSPGEDPGPDFTSLNEDLLEQARSDFLAARTGSDLGVDLDSFEVVGVSFPEAGCINKGLKYAGLASAGAGRLWMQGNNSRDVFVHELGHVYGLEHSNLWKVTNTLAASADAVVGPGFEKEYGDVFDVMGDGESPRDHFHPQAKRRLEWFDPETVSDVTVSGTYQVYRHDAGDLLQVGPGRLRGLRIPKAAGEYYWLGYRAGHPENAHLFRGAYLLWQRANTERCCLLDTTPGSSAGAMDAGLEIGRTYSDARAKVHITPLERGESPGLSPGGKDAWLKVHVQLGAVATNTAPQSTVGIQGQGSCRARDRVSFSIVARDAQEGAQLSYYWDAGDGTRHGQNGLGASTFTHAWETGGSYVLRVTVSDLKGGVSTWERTVTVEDPALDLRRQAPVAAGDFSAVAASPWLAVVVDASGGIQTSSDGSSWTARSVPGKPLNLSFQSVVWSDFARRFTAVGRDWDEVRKLWFGVIYSSDNGLDWKRVFAVSAAPASASSRGTSLEHVAAGSSSMVAVGHSGTVLRSHDGVDWQAVTADSGLSLAASDLVTGLACGGGVFLLVAHPTSGSAILPDAAVYSSRDGVVWTDLSGEAKAGGWGYLKRIFYAKDRFIAGGMDGKMWVSSDLGNTFSAVLESVDEVDAVAYEDGFFFASAHLASGAGAPVQKGLFSIDGTRWIARDASMYPDRSGAVIFQGHLLTVGVGGQLWRSASLAPVGNREPSVQLPAFGSTLTWARVPAAYSVSAADPDGDALRYFWDAGAGTRENTLPEFTRKWVSGGSYRLSVTVSDGRGGVVVRSGSVAVQDPLQKFSPVPSGSTQDLKSVAAGGGLLVAVGEGGEILASSDGNIWQSRSIAGEPNLHFEAVAWGGGRFIAVGRDADLNAGKWQGVVYGSADGASWSVVHKCPVVSGDMSSTLRAVAYGGGKWIACGYGGTVVGSSNGTQWSGETLPELTAGEVVSDVAYGDGVFVAVGHQYSAAGGYNGLPKVWAFSEREGWRRRTLSAADYAGGRDLRRVFFVRDRFVAGGLGSKVRVSTAAGADFATTRDAEEEPRFAMWHDQAYFVVASDATSGGTAVEDSAAVGLVSVDGETWSRLELPPEMKRARAGAVFAGRIFAVGDGGAVWRTDLPLRILRHPESRMVAAQGEVLFEAFAEGNGALTYQWFHNAQPLAEGTQSTLRVSPVTSARAGNYWVKITDDSGQSATSVTASLEMEEPPVETFGFARDLENQGCVEGEAARLEVQIEHAEGAVSYTWSRNGIRIPGQTGSSLVFSRVTPADEGLYAVKASCSSGTVFSREAYLRVWPAGSSRWSLLRPWIVRQPVGRAVRWGSSLELSVEAVCSGPVAGPLSYQWRRNGMNLTGQSQSRLRIPVARAEDAGEYTVLVRSGGGFSVGSFPARVSVLGDADSSALVFQSQPLGGNRLVGKTASLTPVLSASAASYQWFRNGVPMPNATGLNLSVSAERAAGSRVYQLWAVDSAGNGVLSEPALLRTMDFSAWKGSYQGLLRAASGRVNGRATVSVSALGAVTASVQWEAFQLRFTGSLDEGLALSRPVSLSPGTMEGRWAISCDRETGGLAIRMENGGVVVASSLECKRAAGGGVGGLEQSYLLESAGSAATGRLAGVVSPLGLLRLQGQGQGQGAVLFSGKMADGGHWTCSSMWIADQGLEAFARVLNASGGSAGWIGGGLSFGTGPGSEPLFHWSRKAAVSGEFADGFEATLSAALYPYSQTKARSILASASSTRFQIRTLSPSATPQTGSMLWSPQFSSFVGAPANASDSAFSGVRISLDWSTGFVEGISRVSATDSRSRVWRGLLTLADNETRVVVRGYFAGGESIVPFEMMIPPAESP